MPKHSEQMYNQLIKKIILTDHENTFIKGSGVLQWILQCNFGSPSIDELMESTTVCPISYLLVCIKGKAFGIDLEISCFYPALWNC